MQILVCVFFHSQFQKAKHLHNSRLLQSCRGPVPVSWRQRACCCGKWGDAQGTEMWHPQDTATTPTTASSKPNSASFACLCLCPGRSSGAVQLLFLYLEGKGVVSQVFEQHSLRWPHRLSTASLQSSASTEAQGQNPDTFPPFQGYIYSSRNHFLMPPNIRSYRAAMKKINPVSVSRDSRGGRGPGQISCFCAVHSVFTACSSF